MNRDARLDVMGEDLVAAVQLWRHGRAAGMCSARVAVGSLAGAEERRVRRRGRRNVWASIVGAD